MLNSGGLAQSLMHRGTKITLKFGTKTLVEKYCLRTLVNNDLITYLGRSREIQ